MMFTGKSLNPFDYLKFFRKMRFLRDTNGNWISNSKTPERYKNVHYSSSKDDLFSGALNGLLSDWK
jgi:hypothetical protein